MNSASSMTSNIWYDVSCDLETNNNAGGPYNPPPYPPDLTTIEKFLHSPITENGSTDSQSIRSNYKLSDVIDVIQTDPDFSNPARPNTLNLIGGLPAAHSHMLNDGLEILQPRRAVPATKSSKKGAVKKRVKGETKLDNREVFLSNGLKGEILIPGPVLTSQVSHQSGRQQPYVIILEQPAAKILRFRYLCESRSAGSFPGKNSTTHRPTYPTIQIVGFKGRAIVQVSCVTKDKPHRPHPYNLVSKANNDEYKNGICRLKVDTNENYGVVQFKNMGVQCVKRREMAASLNVRQALNVDPFGTGFAHRNDPNSIELISVRLCFQVFLEGDSRGKFNVPLAAVVSDPVYDKRRSAEPKIMKLSDCVCSAAGGSKDIILLCEKVTKGDIQVRFYEENSDWEAYAEFQPSQIHKMYAICFKPPRYKAIDIADPVRVLVHLRRPSDGATSESVAFEYWPANLLQTEPLKRKSNKKQKLEELKILEQCVVSGVGKFSESVVKMGVITPEQGDMPYADPMSLYHYTPNAINPPRGRFSHPSGCGVSPFDPLIINRPSQNQNTWNSPTSPTSSHPSPGTPPQWNIPRSEILTPPSPKTTPKPKQAMNLNSDDLKWLTSLLEPQAAPCGSQNQLSNPNTFPSNTGPTPNTTYYNVPSDSQNKLLNLNTPLANTNLNYHNNLNLTDSLTNLALNDFFPGQ